MPRPLVVITAPVSSHDVREQLGDLAEVRGLDDLEGGESAEAVRRADVLFAGTWSSELGSVDCRQARARFVQLLWAGADELPFGKLPQSAVIASNAGAFAEPMAEHAVAMALALMKRLPQQHAKMAAGTWDQSATLLVRGSVSGIVGFGGIGKATGRLLRVLGAHVYAINTSGQTEEPADFIGTLDDLDWVLGEADVVVLSIPLTRRTRGLIGQRELELMKPTAVLVNVARGAIIDESALYEHLRHQPSFSAGIDTWWREPLRAGELSGGQEFLKLPNVLGSPHNSGGGAGALAEAARRATANIARFLRGEPLTGVVRPDDYVSLGGDSRLSL
jgi:phosphoglycerate dehydrogenase-like enzyme